MKKILFWSAVAILSAVSCNKIENDTPVQESSNVPYFEASVDGADTKTVIDGEAKVSYWNGTEGIRVFDGKNGNGKVYTATVEMTQKAIFTEQDANASLDGDDYLAVYPENFAGSVTWDGNVESPAKKFWLPGEQTAVAGSYDPSTHVAMAYAQAGINSLEFKNVVSLVKVTVANDNVSEICFYGNSQEAITGNFDVTYNGGEPVANFAEGYTANTYAKITGNIENGKTYYISILPCEFSAGFSIEFVIDGVKYIKKLSSKYTVKRNQIINLPVVTFEPEVVATKTVYMLPNSVWASSQGRYAAYCWGTEFAHTWYDMTDADKDGVYEVEVPETCENIIFCCMSAANSANDWNNKIHQTEDLKMPTTDSNCYIVHESQWNTLAYAKTYKEPVPEPETHKTIYLKPGPWNVDGAKFVAYSWKDGGTNQFTEVKATSTNGLFSCQIPIEHTKIIFLRKSKATLDWSNEWNRVGDITLPTNGNNCCEVTGWSNTSYKWSKI